jgi:hypothetical protein
MSARERRMRNRRLRNERFYHDEFYVLNTGIIVGLVIWLLFIALLILVVSV